MRFGPQGGKEGRHAMDNSGFSILIPHYSTQNCDAALHLCIRMFKENTLNEDYELIVVQGYKDPYLFWNEYSERARFERIVFFNNDMLPAPGWDRFMESYVDDNSLVTGYLVEPGVLDVARQNIHRDFGRRPETFRRKEFEAFCSTVHVPEIKEELGWYMPVMLTKNFFRRMGRYLIERPFPHPNDVLFWNHCLSRGARLLRVRSFAYHFQNMSNSLLDAKRTEGIALTASSQTQSESRAPRGPW